MDDQLPDESAWPKGQSSAGRGKAERSARVAVEAIVTLHADSQPIEVTACDVSETGLKIQTDRALQRGPITVKMIGFPMFMGEVRWSGPRHAGIRLLRAIPLDFLREWAKVHGAGRSSDTRFHSDWPNDSGRLSIHPTPNATSTTQSAK